MLIARWPWYTGLLVDVWEVSVGIQTSALEPTLLSFSLLTVSLVPITLKDQRAKQLDLSILQQPIFLSLEYSAQMSSWKLAGYLWFRLERAYLHSKSDLYDNSFRNVGIYVRKADSSSPFLEALLCGFATKTCWEGINTTHSFLDK